MLASVISGAASTIIAAGMLALIGFAGRHKIQKLLNGMDILCKADSSSVDVEDRDFETDLKYNDEVVFLLRNVGEVSLTNLKVYRCAHKNTGPASTLQVKPLKFKKRFQIINSGDGELLQLSFDTADFGINEYYPDYRCYVEMTDSNRFVFRGSLIRSQGGGFFLDGIRRVRKPLPRRAIYVRTEARIGKIAQRYDIDLSVG